MSPLTSKIKRQKLITGLAVFCLKTPKCQRQFIKQCVTAYLLAENDCGFLREVLAAVSVPVVAEGNVDTPERAARCLELGAHTVVVGGAITRPQQITARFVAAIAS